MTPDKPASLATPSAMVTIGSGVGFDGARFELGDFVFNLFDY
jgi:hypothetical protein